MDIVAINGTWQTISFLNFFLGHTENERQICDIVLYEMDKNLKDNCINILSNYDFINSVVAFEDLKSLKANEYENLWIGKLFSAQSKIIADFFKNIPILLFEEGLHSYVPMRKFSIINLLSRKNTIIQKLNTIIKYIFNRNDLIYDNNYFVLSEHKNRIRNRHFLLSFVKSDFEHDIVYNDHLISVLEVVSKVEKFKLERIENKKTVVIVGQCFSNYNLIGKNFELNVYLKLIDYYLGRKYVVYWKGHPRNTDFDDEIKKNYNSRVNFIPKNSLPLECLIYANPEIELCGISSSSLLYSEYIFQRTTKQAATLLINNLNKNSIWYDDFKFMLSMVINKVSGVCTI
ncbi:hypothetical protein DFQ05_0325 [Winogradskyella wandonensis]|uniref:Uncharacterized protein n=1 Tax=Winogradskyella wandonensis TaxID=1442586 RepID=A0A4R1KUD2_9FLAO|nr:polysialyltransferase family glycosyltransferase [Winogradskyella wandonensis]TCK68815.1 hypothetical protein DFQ05_0325 [Winogradskyella wandonensis]